MCSGEGRHPSPVVSLKTCEFLICIVLMDYADSAPAAMAQRSKPAAHFSCSFVTQRRCFASSRNYPRLRQRQFSPVAIVPYYMYTMCRYFSVQVIQRHRNAPPVEDPMVFSCFGSGDPQHPQRGCRISSEMRHEKNPKDSSSQGWRKGVYHHNEKRISTKHFFFKKDVGGIPHFDKRRVIRIGPIFSHERAV